MRREFKLIQFYHDIDEWELYDRVNDPNEINNVYNNPACAEVAEDLKLRLAKVRAKYGDATMLGQELIELYNLKKSTH